MGESNTDLGFNINQQLSITYRKVVPWGTSKTMNYDMNQKLLPSMKYQTSLNAISYRNEDYIESASSLQNVPVPEDSSSDNSSSEPLTEQKNGNASALGSLRKAIEDQVFTEYLNAYIGNGLIMAEDTEAIEAIRNTLRSETDDELAAEVELIRKGCRKNGVLMMDDEGHLKQGC